MGIVGTPWSHGRNTWCGSRTPLKNISNLSEDWVYQARLRKWRSAEKLAVAVDGRWNARLVGWRPCLARGRHVGRPRTRWEDFFVATAGGEWLEAAREPGLWRLLEPALKE